MKILFTWFRLPLAKTYANIPCCGRGRAQNKIKILANIMSTYDHIAATVFFEKLNMLKKFLRLNLYQSFTMRLQLSNSTDGCLVSSVSRSLTFHICIPEFNHCCWIVGWHMLLSQKGWNFPSFLIHICISLTNSDYTFLPKMEYTGSAPMKAVCTAWVTMSV